MLAKINITSLKNIGIRGRSFVAFSVLTVFTFLVSIVGWISYHHIQSELERTVQVNIHSLKLMFDLKEYGTSISIKAPTLYVAKNKASQEKIWSELNHSIDEMLNSLLLKNTIESKENSHSFILSHIQTLRTPLENLNENISVQLDIEKEKQVFGENLRWQTAKFLNEIDTSILNAKSNWEGNFDKNLELLYRVKADFNLLANLIDRVQHLPDINSLIAIRIYSSETIDSLNQDLRSLHQQPSYSYLRQAVNQIMLLAQGKGNIFSIRRKEREIKETGALQLTQINQHLDSLNSLLSKYSKLSELAAQDAVDNVKKTIKRARIWVIFLVGGSLLFSILMVWLYIGQNIVGRITSLNTSMRFIAKGNLEQQIPVYGNDEIGAMADSLLSFRDQMSSLQEELVQSGKLAALGQLSAGIAHEINQPLTAIRHYTHNSSRLIDNGQLKEAEENLKHITLLTKRIVSTINQLKSLAKGGHENVKEVHVDQAINNSVMMLSGHKILSETDLDISFDTEDNVVYADPVQLEQVIINLLSNALDALVEIEVKQIHISCHQDKENITIMITDNGKGIAKEQRNKIFDTFFTTKRRGQNLGLGLSISYNIVKNFGGSLSIDTETKTGASFSIQLPRAR